MLLLISGVFELQGPFSKGNLPRFLWNVMALGTARGQPGGACDPFKKLCPDGQVREAAGGGGASGGVLEVVEGVELSTWMLGFEVGAFGGAAEAFLHVRAR